jgi:hypothetical protein
MEPYMPFLFAVAIIGVLLLGRDYGRESSAKGRLRGIQETMHLMTRGISHHYEREGEDLPERVAKCVDHIKARVEKAATTDMKCEAYRVRIWCLIMHVEGGPRGVGIIRRRARRPS